MIDTDMVLFCFLNKKFIFIVAGNTGNNNLERTISTGTLDYLIIIIIIITILIVIIVIIITSFKSQGYSVKHWCSISWRDCKSTEIRKTSNQMLLFEDR